MALAVSELETLSLSDGTSLKLARTPGMGLDEWKETKKYLEENPEEARKWESFSKDSKAVRQYSQQTAISEYYQSKISSGDELTTNRVMGLEKNPEFAHIFEDVKRGGMAAAQQHSYNEPLMLKVSRAVGGIPEEVKDALVKIHSEPLTLQEACKMGDLKALQNYLSSASSPDLEAKDAKGISCLGYAVGANRIAVVKLLLEKKADPAQCDASSGTALHYAAAYGRNELLEFFLKGGLEVNAKTTQGQTPLSLATKNKQKEAIELLKAKGGQM